MESLNTGVFDRDGSDALSANVFYGLLGLVLIYGFGGTVWVAQKMAAMHYRPGIWDIIILGLVIPILGIVIALKSDNPIISFIGYNMLVAPFGVILSPVLNAYQPAIIERAFTITCGVTAVMMVAGFVFPRFFESIGGALLVCLTGLVVVRFAQLFIPSIAHMGWVEWASAGIFSLYIGYDMHRAAEVPKTMDNAVDIALALYLDIINLFLNILRIVGGDSSD